MPTPSPSVGLAVPAYEPDLERLCPYLDTLAATVADEVLVALDDPDPGIADALREHARVSVSPERRGKGAAVTDAFDALADDGVDRLVLADADASTPPESIAGIVAALDGGDAGAHEDGPLRDTSATVAVGTRRHPDADVRSHQSLARRGLGAGFVSLARTLLGVRLSDYQCGAKAVTTDVWRDVRPYLHEPGFAWDVEFVAVADALGERIVEVPVTWEDQPNKTVSPIGDTLSMARGLLAARERAATVRGASSPLARIVCRPTPLVETHE